VTEEVHPSSHQRERNFDSSFNPLKFFYSPKDMLVKLDAIFEHKVDKTIYNKMEIYQETGGFFKTSKDLEVVSNKTHKLKGTIFTANQNRIKVPDDPIHHFRDRRTPTNPTLKML
jgi:hypothetical protein